MSKIKQSNVYDKMPDFIESVFTVFKHVQKLAANQKDEKLKFISLIIFNYVKMQSKLYNVDLKNIEQPDCINLIPIFEYIAYNNIELYDFSTISMDDVNTSNNDDLERFVLTHIYYITQQKA